MKATAGPADLLPGGSPVTAGFRRSSAPSARHALGLPFLPFLLMPLQLPGQTPCSRLILETPPTRPLLPSAPAPPPVWGWVSSRRVPSGSQPLLPPPPSFLLRVATSPSCTVPSLRPGLQLGLSVALAVLQADASQLTDRSGVRCAAASLSPGPVGTAVWKLGLCAEGPPGLQSSPPLWQASLHILSSQAGSPGSARTLEWQISHHFLRKRFQFQCENVTPFNESISVFPNLSPAGSCSVFWNLTGKKIPALHP